MKKIFFSLLFLFTIFILSDSFAQNKVDGVVPTPITATISAKGTVLSPISITATRDLDFGNDILPGINRIVDKSSNNSGKFTIMGQPGKEINITITTPEILANGEATMPIVFSQSDAGYKLPGESMVEFDPANITNATFGTDGTMEIFLGGTVIPAYTQAGGDYAGTVTIVFYYTGN